MASPVRVRNCLLCEHVSRSDGNRHTLVNVYSGDVVVAHMPTQLQFGLYMELEGTPQYQGAFSLEIRWLKRTYLKATATVDARSTENNAVIALPSFLLPVDRDGVLQMFFWGDGLPRRKILSKKIYADKDFTS